MSKLDELAQEVRAAAAACKEAEKRIGESAAAHSLVVAECRKAEERLQDAKRALQHYVMGGDDDAVTR